MLKKEKLKNGVYMIMELKITGKSTPMILDRLLKVAQNIANGKAYEIDSRDVQFKLRKGVKGYALGLVGGEE